MAVSPSVQDLLWRPHNLLSKDEVPPRPLRRVEQYRRAITPDTGVEHLRPCGRKGGHVVAQPLTRRVLQPLGNVFVGCRVRAGEVRVRTQEGARNAWFHANRGREAERALKRARFLLSRGIDPASGVGCAVPLRAETSVGGRRPRAAGGRRLSAAGEEEILGVRRAGDERAPSSALDAEFAATVAGTRGKYKMGKWIPHAEVCVCVCARAHFSRGVSRYLDVTLASKKILLNIFSLVPFLADGVGRVQRSTHTRRTREVAGRNPTPVPCSLPARCSTDGTAPQRRRRRRRLHRRVR